jgi:AcrR family transcriptional regulator
MINVAALAPERPRKRDAEATRAAILQAAKDHFARSGYDGAFLRDIAADAGADAALINRYFGGKDGLFAAALKDRAGRDLAMGSQEFRARNRKNDGGSRASACRTHARIPVPAAGRDQQGNRAASQRGGAGAFHGSDPRLDRR